MKQELTTLYNTLSIIETKGQSTEAMAACLRFVRQLIKNIEQNELTSGEQGSYPFDEKTDEE